MFHDAYYVRVSSRSQTDASQLPDLERFARSSDFAARWYRDSATGTTTDRPGWRKLDAALKAREVRRVVVWRLDRLGRSARDLSALIAELVAGGVGLVSLREGLDLSTPAGRLMVHVVASVAQYETEVRSERQRAGIAAAQARGVRFGRPKGEGGRPGKPVKVTPEQEDVVRRLKAERTPVARIARAVGLSRGTVYAILGPADARVRPPAPAPPPTPAGRRG